MGPYLQAAAELGGSRVAAIGVAQEFAPVWTGYQRESTSPVPQFTSAKAQRRVTCYWWEFPMRQIEVSRTIVFNAPRHARVVLGARGRRPARPGLLVPEPPIRTAAPRSSGPSIPRTPRGSSRGR
jgi:hypothetical protein